jgi:hypothetical protein
VYTGLTAVVLFLAIGGLALSESGQEPIRSQNPASQGDLERFKPVSGNLVRVMVVFPDSEDKSFRATELEGGVIRVSSDGKSWCISPRIKDTETISLEVFEVSRSTDGRMKESFDRIDAFDVNRTEKKQVTRAPFSVQLEKIIFRDKTPSHRSGD